MPKRSSNRRDINRLAADIVDLRRIQREISPFVKKRQFEHRTTAGQWRPTSTLLGDEERHDLALARAEQTSTSAERG